jgi:hypothetical protein
MFFYFEIFPNPELPNTSFFYFGARKNYMHREGKLPICDQYSSIVQGGSWDFQLKLFVPHHKNLIFAPLFGERVLNPHLLARFPSLMILNYGVSCS